MLLTAVFISCCWQGLPFWKESHCLNNILSGSILIPFMMSDDISLGLLPLSNSAHTQFFPYLKGEEVSPWSLKLISWSCTCFQQTSQLCVSTVFLILSFSSPKSEIKERSLIKGKGDRSTLLPGSHLDIFLLFRMFHSFSHSFSIHLWNALATR